MEEEAEEASQVWRSLLDDSHDVLVPEDVALIWPMSAHAGPCAVTPILLARSSVVQE